MEKVEKSGSLENFASQLDPKNQLSQQMLRQLRGGDGGSTPPPPPSPPFIIIDEVMPTKP